jgi:hypothetical protein
MARLSSATMGDHALSSSPKKTSAAKQGKGSTDQSNMVQPSVPSAKDADAQRVHKHVRVSSESSAASARSSSASSKHPAFVATIRPPSDTSACSLFDASEDSGRTSGGSAAEWQQMLQKRGLTPAKKLPRPLTAASECLDVPQSVTTSKHSSTSTSRSSLVAHIADANSQFPTPPNHSPSTLKDVPTGHHVPQRANLHSLVLTDDTPASTATAHKPITPRPLLPSKATVPALAPTFAAAAPLAFASVLKTRSSPIMANSSWLEDGILASATMSDAIAYFTGFPGLPQGSRPPLAGDADSVRAIWVAWRHHVGSREFFACVRRLYEHWSRLAPSSMDAFVDQLCSWWFDHWMVTDEEIVEDIRAFIQDIAAAQPDQAAWLTNAFNKRKSHLVLRSDMSAFVVPDAAGSEHTAESDALSVYRFLGEFMDSAAGRDEFAGQLTVVFNAIYESLPHPLILILDWYLNGDDEQYLPLENTLLSLHEDLLKWVAKSIMGAVDGASLVKVVAFWMDIGRVRDLAPKIRLAAIDARTALLGSPEHDGRARDPLGALGEGVRGAVASVRGTAPRGRGRPDRLCQLPGAEAPLERAGRLHPLRCRQVQARGPRVRPAPAYVVRALSIVHLTHLLYSPSPHEGHCTSQEGNPRHCTGMDRRRPDHPGRCAPTQARRASARYVAILCISSCTSAHACLQYSSGATAAPDTRATARPSSGSS